MTPPEKPELLEHLKLHCETAPFSVEEGPDFSLVLFPDSPSPDLTTISSVGISAHTLGLSDETTIHQELMVTAKSTETEVACDIIAWLAENMIRIHRGIERGEFIELPEKLQTGSATHLFSITPMFYSDSLAVYSKEGLNKVLFVWLVPVTAEEFAYGEKLGVDALIDLFAQKDPPIWDTFRESVA